MFKITFFIVIFYTIIQGNTKYITVRCQDGSTILVMYTYILI
jgi:hypothetical protein